jgi:ferredoxin--NADP+ reductase
MAQWLDATVVKRRDWNEHLFSLSFSCQGFPAFKAGQFTKFGIQQETKVLSRPYSLVNGCDTEHLEIIAVPVEEGLLSAKLHTLQLGDSLKVMAPATGFLTLDQVPASQNLWLIATGTGVGPFLSILSSAQTWQRFEQITLVYGIRHVNDLAYGPLIDQWIKAYPNKFHFVPVVSREEQQGALQGRIPALLANGQIVQHAKQSLNAEDSQVMLCGNPQMIEDALVTLQEMGLKKHLRRSPGQVSMERYW